MKKNLLVKSILFMALMFTFIFVGKVNAADVVVKENPTAESQTEKADLKSAWEEVIKEGGTITLEKDATLGSNETLELNKENVEVTINLNGKNITSSDCVRMINIKHGSLVVTGKGKIENTSGDKQNRVFSIYGSNEENATDYSKLKIDKDVEIVATYPVYVGWVDPKAESGSEKVNYGTVVDIYGTLTSNPEKTENAISVNGALKKGNTKIHIYDDATITSAKGVGIYLAGYAETTIDKATVTGAIGIGIKAGKLTLNNSIITGTGEKKATPDLNNSGIDMNGSAIQIESNESYAEKVNLTINGGTYTSKNYSAITEYLASGSSTCITEIAISDGEFKSAKDEKAIVTSSEFKSTEKAKGFIKGGKFDNGFEEGTFVNSTAVEASIKEGENTTYYVGANRVQEGAKAAKNGAEIKVEQGNIDLSNLADGVTVSNQGNGKVTLDGTTVGKTPVDATVTKQIKELQDKINTGNQQTQNLQKQVTELKKQVNKPAKVTGVKASKQTTTSITVSWKKVSGATGYRVYRATSKNGKYTKIKDLKGTSVKDTKLKAGKTYYYKVRAYTKVDGTNVYGSYSSKLGTSTKTKTPTLKVKKASKKAKLSWKKVSGATGYQVYMRTGKKGSYKKVKTVTKASTVKYTKTGLKKGKTYYFKVRTYKTVSGKKVYSSYSTVKSVKIK